MPFYEYQCTNCLATEEHYQKMGEKKKRKCKACGKSKLERVISSSNIIFKGPGFYCNDYPKSN